MLELLLNSTVTKEASVSTFILVLLVALILGVTISLVHQKNSNVSQSFSITLAVLPSIVAAIIWMINDSIGAGIAVAGAFSLVRFRSIPGSAKSIGALFLAMAIGLISGMGYIQYAVVFTGIVTLTHLILEKIQFGVSKEKNKKRTIKITIPEDLNYSDVFEDIFDKYTNSRSLMDVRTTNLGSLFKLTYEVSLNDSNDEKEMIDQLRTRNGNLEIVSTQYVVLNESL